MKRLNAAVERFALNHPRFGIPNLMRYIVIGNALVYFLAVFSSGYSSVSFLAFNWDAICQGEVWRLVTFIFLPGYYTLRDAIWLIVFLYLYYMIGTTLEQRWGTAKFNLYYLTGVLLSVITGVISGLVFGHAWIAGADYINMSMFFAFSMLYPDVQLLLMFIIPIKIKWLAWLNGILFALAVISNLLAGNIVSALMPVVALLNFIVYFWDYITQWLGYRRRRAKHQTSHQTIEFKSAVKQQQRKAQQQGYHHKCCICGKTDTDFPDLQFRYCSRCAGYRCYCEEHIFNHTHFTE